MSTDQLQHKSACYPELQASQSVSGAAVLLWPQLCLTACWDTTTRQAGLRKLESEHQGRLYRTTPSTIEHSQNNLGTWLLENLPGKVDTGHS